MGQAGIQGNALLDGEEFKHPLAPGGPKLHKPHLYRSGLSALLLSKVNTDPPGAATMSSSLGYR